MEFTDVDSSNLKSVGYDQETSVLGIIFLSNEDVVYKYSDVDADVYVNLMAAPSHGKFFNANIKNKYEFTKETR